MQTWKEPAWARGGMAVTAHPLASAAAVQIMAAGGNAVDAAVAAGVAVTVVEPMMSTIFGNSYILIRTAAGAEYAFDCYGCAPQLAHERIWEFEPDGRGGERVKANARSEGHKASLVGGALLGMHMAHSRFGRLAWKDLFGPAIRFAREGFPASPFYRDALAMGWEKVSRYPASLAQFAPGGALPAVGDRIVRSDYARTLELIAENGPGELYGGSVGLKLVQEMERGGGLIRLDDLRGYRVVERTPLHGTYRGYDLTVLPPSCSGGAHVMQMLNILEGLDVANLGFGTPASVHALLEANRIAFADRSRYMGDPDRIEIPLEWLTSKAYAAERRAGINPERAVPQFPGEAPGPDARAAEESAHTTHLTLADGEGNLVVTTQTANNIWGSGVTVPGTGLLLNNGMITLDAQPGRPNSVGPGRRGLSTTCPTIISRGGEPWLALGTPGGNRIIAAIVQAIVNLVDHGMSLQQAVEAPRCHAGLEAEAQLEPGFSEETFQAVLSKGHQAVRSARVAGGMQAIRFHPGGLLEGASCWRSDGAPIGCSGFRRA